MKVRAIPLEKCFIKKNIRTDTDEELGEQMQSMLKVGQLQPIGVYPRGERYEIVWGHRRFRAAQMNGEATIDAHVLDPARFSEADIPILKLQENTVRKPLCREEILAAADEIRRKNPSLSDKHVDLMIGKRPGYIGYLRSVANAVNYLADAGLARKKLAMLQDHELMDLRARMETAKPPARGNAGAFHRPGIPKCGIQIITPRGPQVVVICSGQNAKRKVIAVLKNFAKEIV